ncbi:MAG: iron-sulfur protein [Acidimicrobiales bacterium]|nr:iron-sulfur protein [Acidimicrobiales bacterium]
MASRERPRPRVDPSALGERLEATEALDRLADPALRAVKALLPAGPAKDALHGMWLGHPLHPLLTDLPIGFWTSAFVLDLVGGRKAQPGADALVGIGVASALPTIVSGLADWSELKTAERRTGAVHAVANGAATALYGLSYAARRRGRRGPGIAWAMVGATAATVGGFLGGHLSYRRAAGVNHAADAPADRAWGEATLDGPLAPDRLVLAHLGDEPLAAVRTDAGPAALYERCSHLGGPLHEGALVDGCVRCPWHGSTFRVEDGSIVRGPATAPQPAYELREEDGRTMARRRAPAGG